MSERSEHLIERAAAKLRGAAVVRTPDDAGPAPAPHFAPPRHPFAPLPDTPMPSVHNGFAGPDLVLPLPGETIPDRVDGPIPPPAPPLTRPVAAAATPALTIPQGPPHPRTPALGIPALAGIAPNGAAPANAAPASASATLASAGLNAPAPSRPAPRSFDFAAPAAPAAAPSAFQPPTIVQLDALERAGMVVARTTRTRISEEYRIAIGRILRVLHETADGPGTHNVVMVTSARPGEGKSFSALNLAGSIAQNGTDAVLLVDVDPKVKPLSDQLGLGEERGFLDLVADPSLRPEDMLRVTAIPNLAVMPVGTRLGGAAQTATGTASMRPIIPTVARLARRFPKHLIMLDAPPCLSTSDPHTLAPHVGQVVLVVEAERTQRSEVEAAVDLVRVCPSITLLLNKVRMTTSHTFGAYDYFGSYT